MKSLIKSLIWISVIFSSCDYFNFTKGVHKDAERIFTSHKKFFKSLAVIGVISEKKYCEKCHFNKYQLIINLKEKEPEVITLGNQSYQPYFFFNAKNQLTISVTKDLYEFVQKDNAIEKQMNSDCLMIGNQKYKLISSEEYKWLPD